MALKVRLIAVGKVKEPFIQAGIAEYSKRLSGYLHLEVVEVPDESIPDDPSDKILKKILDTEGRRVGRALHASETVILLDLAGSEWSSVEFAERLSVLKMDGKSRIAFVIGGSLGVSEDLKKRADLRWRLSDLTFPHQLVRVLVLEQLYRACRICRGERYHR